MLLRPLRIALSWHRHVNHLISSTPFTSTNLFILSPFTSLLIRLIISHLTTSQYSPGWQLTSPFQLHLQTTSCPIQNHLHIPRNWSGASKEIIITVPSKPHLSLNLQNIPPTTSLKSNPDLIDHLLSDLTACLLTTSRNIPPKKLHHAKRPGWDPTLKSVSRLCKYHYRAWVRAGRPHSPENHLRIAYNPPREPSGYAYVYRENASTTYFTIRWTPTSILGDSFFLFVIAPPPTVTNQSLLESQSMALNTPTETSRKAGPHYFETLGTPPQFSSFSPSRHLQGDL